MTVADDRSGRGGVEQSSDSTPLTTRRGDSRLVGLGKILLLDAVGPFVAYTLLKDAGYRDVSALVLSGCLPAIGVLVDVVRFRTVDVIGAVVLAGIVVGAGLAGLTDSPRAILLEGAVPTLVFAGACLWSLRSARPLMFRFAQASMGGEHSVRGMEFDRLFVEKEGFRHYFRRITLVWGLAYVLESATKVVVTQTQSTGVAVATSRFLAYPVAGVLVVWMFVYNKVVRRRYAARAVAATAGPTR